MAVSIPYRYKQNKTFLSFYSPSTSSFQSPIGTNKTVLLINLYSADEDGFQSPIGTNKTPASHEAGRRKSVFQSPIGTNKTYLFPDVKLSKKLFQSPIGTNKTYDNIPYSISVST